MANEVYNSQRLPRYEMFTIVPASMPTGTAAQSTTGVTEGTYLCTSIKNGTGDYTINFNRKFGRTPVVVAMAFHASAKLFLTVKVVSSTSVQLLCWTDAGVAGDATSVNVLVFGTDSADGQIAQS